MYVLLPVSFSVCLLIVFLPFFFALIAGHRASMQPGAACLGVRSRIDEIAARSRALIYRLDPFQGPRIRARRRRGKRKRKRLIARVEIRLVESPVARSPSPEKQASTVNRTGRPRVICSVVDWSSANLDRAYTERSWRSLFVTNATISLDPASTTRRIYCKETTGIGRLQCCCSCNVREQTACIYFLFPVCCFAEYANAVGGGRDKLAVRKSCNKSVGDDFHRRGVGGGRGLVKSCCPEGGAEEGARGSSEEIGCLVC